MKAINTRQIEFIVLIIILALLVIGFSVYNVAFLLTNLDKALGADEAMKAKPINFEIERFEKLELIK